MSLLLEALKKAEQAKRESAAEQAPAAADERAGAAEPSPGEPARSQSGTLRAEADRRSADARQEPVITRANLPDINQPLEIDAGDLERAPKLQFQDTAQAASEPRESLRIEEPPLVDTPPLPRDDPEAQQPARDAVRQLFDVKEVDYNPRKPFYITVGVLVAAGVGYGGYVWWQLQPRYAVNTAAVQNAPKGPPSPVPAPQPAAAVEAPPGDEPAGAPQGTAAAEAPAKAVQARESAVASPRQAAGSIPPPAAQGRTAVPPAAGQTPAVAGAPAAAGTPPRPSAPAAAAPPSGTVAARPATGTRPAPAARTPAPQQQAERQTPVTVTPPSAQRDETLERAYADFQNGNLNASRAGYERVMARDPNNRDGLLGLAALDVRARSFDIAIIRYQRLLELDPRDSAAQAGLIALAGTADPVQTESRLKSMIANQPEALQLQFVLGNQYAAQGRWSEAQESYFKAYSGDEGNPDYAFNLAVSLDHLRQPRPALQYYRKALALAGSRAAAFDLAGVQARVRELER